MAYPLAVDVEFCPLHRVWYAFDGTKIIAFNSDKDVMEDLFPNGHFIPRRDTVIPGSRKGSIADGDRLHFGRPVPSSTFTEES